MAPPSKALMPPKARRAFYVMGREGRGRNEGSDSGRDEAGSQASSEDGGCSREEDARYPSLSNVEQRLDIQRDEVHSEPTPDVPLEEASLAAMGEGGSQSGVQGPGHMEADHPVIASLWGHFGAMRQKLRSGDFVVPRYGGEPMPSED